jgi:hypothetical protein
MATSLVTTNTPALPSHGRIACRRCFTSDEQLQTVGKWQMVNDPAAWGSDTPSVLLLGFSKGFTQADAFRTGRFEDIPFKDMRPRLTEELRLLGIIGPSETVDQKMTATEAEMAFGSFVRCSLSRTNKCGKLVCTGEVMPKAFSEEISTKVETCAKTYLADLPSTLELVLLLGTTDAYIEGCRAIIRSLYRSNFSHINDVSYRTGRVTWVHISHPSGLNGHHNTWMAGDPATTPGRKRNLAIEAIQNRADCPRAA